MDLKNFAQIINPVLENRDPTTDGEVTCMICGMADSGRGLFTEHTHPRVALQSESCSSTICLTRSIPLTPVSLEAILTEHRGTAAQTLDTTYISGVWAQSNSTILFMYVSPAGCKSQRAQWPVQI